jgi:hypothetical protein
MAGQHGDTITRCRKLQILRMADDLVQKLHYASWQFDNQRHYSIIEIRATGDHRLRRQSEDGAFGTVLGYQSRRRPAMAPVRTVHSVGQYLTHYHTERNHQSLNDEIIQPGDEVSRHEGVVESRERLGGMLRYYFREAV